MTNVKDTKGGMIKKRPMHSWIMNYELWIVF
jgi:hypothetical protein